MNFRYITMDSVSNSLLVKMNIGYEHQGSHLTDEVKEIEHSESK